MPLEARKNLRVVVVDDSVLMRAMLRSALEAEGDITVAGLAKEPFEAREMIRATDPDVVTLDVDMPGMNGLEFLEKIMALRPMPVVMVSSHTCQGAEVTLNALEIGAVDFVQKPNGAASAAEFAELLRRKVRLARGARVRQRVAAPAAPRAVARPNGRGPSLIAIGASTGGVAAVGSLLQRLPSGLPPVVIVVHMPDKYTGRFAQRLASQTGHDVAEATEGERLRPGMFRIAPGLPHMEVARQGADLVTRLKDGPLVSGHRPSVDVCFSSVAKTVPGRALGVILTGMGRDGAAGMLEMRRGGSVCLGEAESSCVVYGMPKAAREVGAVNEEHDLDRLPQRICELVAAVPARV